MSTILGPKGPGHDQRRCRFLAANPALDRNAIAEGVDRTRLPLFLCLYKGAEHPLFTTMAKCKYCRTTGLWYEPRDEGADATSAPAMPPTPTAS
jgi:hypothetical protein